MAEPKKRKHSSKSKCQGKDRVSCKAGNTKLKYDNEILLKKMNRARLVNQALMQTKMDKALQQQKKEFIENNSRMEANMQNEIQLKEKTIIEQQKELNDLKQEVRRQIASSEYY